MDLNAVFQIRVLRAQKSHNEKSQAQHSRRFMLHWLRDGEGRKEEGKGGVIAYFKGWRSFDISELFKKLNMYGIRESILIRMTA